MSASRCSHNHKIGSHALTCHPGLLNDIRFNSSSTEAQILLVIIDHGPSPPLGDAYYHWRRIKVPYYYVPRESENPLF
ncbi:hypothetical protein AVEN_137715-1 [Araneus ventricosus]|uniref:Uncharacterized protein n=1 Tax=Araneus ventricosus TaxID=182803 RepID=A0A4Y2J312_ARAVE|nr:hypothetical protein AVEN_137715-1 [Araneus ventricosus]